MHPDYQPGRHLECTIIDAGDKDQCFGRLEDGPGVFVHGRSVPGDRVRIKITRVHKRYLDAQLVEVLRPSPDRTEAPCPTFMECGGCKWQNLTYEAECTQKHRQIIKVLQHVGRFTDVPVNPVIPSPTVYQARNRITLDMARKASGPLTIGYHAVSNPNRLVDTDACLLASEPMNQALRAVRQGLRACDLPAAAFGVFQKLIVQQSAADGALLINLVTGTPLTTELQNLIPILETGLAGNAFSLVNTTHRETGPPDTAVLHGPGFLTEQLGPFRLKNPPNSFFQVNTRQAVALAEWARSQAAAGPGHRLVELFSGIGTLSLFLGQDAGHFEGYEGDAQAVETALENAACNKLPGLHFTPMNLHHGRDLKKQWAGKKPDIIVTDPPRTGMTPALIDAIQYAAPERLVYVSCNPATFARDARMLCDAGAFILQEVQPFDMFPRTAHVELVARFSCG